MAIGVMGWSSNTHQFVDAGLRTATDAGPLTLMARQNGVVVTYRFDMRAYSSSGSRRAGVGYGACTSFNGDGAGQPSVG